MNLNDVHKAQISRFTTFFKGKRDRVLADREGEKNDFLTDRLSDESAIFNYADVRSIVEAYHLQVMACLRDELSKTINLSAVFVAQLLAQAETSGASLQVEDISAIEDQSRIGEIQSLPAVSAPPLAAPKPRAPLTAVQSSGTADPAVLQELQDLKEENRMMKDRNLQMQTEMSTVLRERSSLSTELEQVKSNLKQHITKGHAGGTANTAEYERQLADAKAELEATKKEMNQRLADSSQFKELKSIVKKKANENKELKQRLVAAGLALPDAGEGVELEADSD